MVWTLESPSFSGREMAHGNCESIHSLFTMGQIARLVEDAFPAFFADYFSSPPTYKLPLWTAGGFRSLSSSFFYLYSFCRWFHLISRYKDFHPIFIFSSTLYIISMLLTLKFHLQPELFCGILSQTYLLDISSWISNRVSNLTWPEPNINVPMPLSVPLTAFPVLVV